MSKVLSIRIPEPLYRQLSIMASERGQSINILVNKALERFVTESERKSLYDAFTYVGQRYGSRIGHTLPLQRKMMVERQTRREENRNEG